MTDDETVVVSARRMLTADVCEFELRRADGALFEPAEPGAHITVHTPSGEARSYSLTADVSDSSSSSRERNGDDWDWDDAYPSPPAKGSYRGSFSKSDFLASLGLGADFLLFQVRDHFNMSLIPELMFYRGLTTISKDGEFGGGVHNEGYLLSLSVAFGF